jgi:hypothetical protein
MATKAKTEKTVDEGLAATLDILEKVFSGQYEFADEGLQELDIYPAEVRRRWPNLYRVIMQPRVDPNAEPVVPMVTLHDASAFELIASVEQVLTRTLAQHVGNLAKGIAELNTQMAVLMTVRAVNPLPNNGHPQPNLAELAAVGAPEPVNGMQVHDYNAWAQELAHTSGKDQQWAIRWDAAPAPPFRVGATVTLPDPRSGRRTRFQVVDQLENDTYIYKAIAFLSPKQ